MPNEKRLSNILLAVFAGISLLFLILPLTPGVRFARAAVAYAIYPPIFHAHEASEYLIGVPEKFIGLLRADQENQDLKERLKQQGILGSQLEGVLRENDHLRELLGFFPRLPYQGLWARVLERDPANWFRSCWINRGSQDGVGLGAPVIGVFSGRVGLVGRIVEVQPNVSQVLLATDELSSVAASLEPTDWEGLIEGTGRPQLRMNYLSLDARFRIGQEVVVSASSAVFPPGLPVGRVLRVLPREPFFAFQAVEVRPMISAERLKEVFVVRYARGRARPQVPGAAGSGREEGGSFLGPS